MGLGGSFFRGLHILQFGVWVVEDWALVGVGKWNVESGRCAHWVSGDVEDWGLGSVADRPATVWQIDLPHTATPPG